MKREPETLTPVTRSHPCPVCGGDHKCSVGGGGLILCGRSAGPADGFTDLGPARKDPQFHAYRVAGWEPPPRPARPTGPRAVDWESEAARHAAGFDAAARAKLAKTLGLPADVFDLFCGLGAKRKDPDGPCWTFPERDGAGAVVGLTRRFIGTGEKKAAPGSRRGLSVVKGWRDRPGPVLVVEGASDTLAAAAAGLAAVGRPGAMTGADDLAAMLADWSADRGIVVVGENDARPSKRRPGETDWPGKAGAEAVAAALAAKLGRAVRVAFPPAGAKDVRAWLTGRVGEELSWPEAGRDLLNALLGTATTVEPTALWRHRPPRPRSRPPRS